jgi:hypothetical protein
MREFSLGPLFRKPSIVDPQRFENLVATKTEAVVERASYAKGCIVPTLAGDRRWCPINISADGIVHVVASAKQMFG